MGLEIAARAAVIAILALALPFRPAAAGELPAAGALDPRLESFDRLLREFLPRHGIPGAALAVTHEGRLVLARGYGRSGPESDEPVRPTNLFRIASISKPVTAVALLRLVEMEKVRLDARIADVLPFDRWADGAPSVDPRLRDITVRHLLEHRGGWDRDVSFDPMFRPVEFAKELGLEPPASPEAVIRCMLRRPLDFAPGERYAYSNFGYCLLGRLIEEVTGQGYERWVRENVLAPIGIRGMRLGRTRLERRATGEVLYHHPDAGASCFAEDLGAEVLRPYGAFHLEAMDAHGGWLASAVDLARFACAFDEPARSPLLSEESIREMHARPEGAAGHEEDGSPKDVWYGLGWQVRDVGGGRRNAWHGGSLPGTATLLVRRHDGRNWAVLFNSRASVDRSPRRIPANRGGNIAREIDRLLHRAADAVVEWPEHDLFASFDAPSEEEAVDEKERQAR